MTGTVADFDTLAAARELESAGFAKRQAEAAAVAIRDGRAGLATKTDIRRLENKIEGCATKADLANLKADMLKAAIGIVIAQTALTAGSIFGLIEIFGGAP